MDIDKIVELANTPEIIKLCEPNIAFPQTLEKWMVIRVLKAQELLNERLS